MEKVRVAMRDGSQNLRGEFFGEEDRAFGLATGAEIPRAAGECQKVLRMTFWAPNPGKAALKPATTQKLLYGTNHNRPQWSRARLEAFFVTADVTVEVVFKELIKLRLFGMPGPVLRRRFGDKAAAGILARNEVRGDAAAGEDRQPDAGHGGLTSPDGRFGAAHRDLTAMGVKLANQSGRRPPPIYSPSLPSGSCPAC